MQLPARIGKYELEEFLGGGMSHVYRARDTVIGRTVAVKILTEAGCEDADAKARFLAEARMAGNISHDNILGIYDFGEDENHHPYMVMEFLKGEDLRHAIKNGRLPDLKSKLNVALQLARALEYIHSQKIIHRDIKPENVHLNPAGVVKLIDFGIAKTEGLGMTRTGYVVGTPYYMAPEQVTGQNITEQVDVYSFGILLFELIVGLRPVSGESMERVFYSILNEPLDLKPLETLGAPQPLYDLIARCTAKDPAARPQGFGPVCAELSRMLSDSEAPTEAMPAVVAAPSAKWKPVAVLAGLLALALIYFALRPATVAKKEAAAPAALAPTLALPSGDMVLVPAGAFLFGKDKQSVDLPAFYIDRTTVTNAAYAAFAKATNHSLPEGFPQDKSDYPVVNVNFVDARAFAEWAGKRLPTAREWEKAARGTDGRIYPWGNEPDASRANLATEQIKPAADYPAGASPSGALQMIGNVWQLIDQVGSPSEMNLKYFRSLMKPPPSAEDAWYTIRGGSFHIPLQDGLIWDSTNVPARWKNIDIGFRCAKDAH